MTGQCTGYPNLVEASETTTFLHGVYRYKPQSCTSYLGVHVMCMSVINLQVASHYSSV